jgi:TonB family protein
MKGKITMHKRIVLIALICVIVNLPGLGAAVMDTHNAQREPGRRLAIVIGNDTYEAAPLHAARNDARSMARVLTELGFSVTLLQDATREMIASALATVGGKIRADDVALFYFSGHGAQVDGENFLVPVDFKSFTSEALRLGTIRANEVLKIFERARVTILVLDACRVNPFSGDRAGGRGLAAMEARGSLVAFGAGSEQVALDGPRDGNGMFTAALLKELKEPGLTVQEVFRRARQRVYQDTNGKQFPAVYDGLIGDFTFLAQPSGALPSHPPEPEAAEPSAPHRITETEVVPKLIKEVKPVYPETARNAQVQGIVIIEATIDHKGKVINARIIRSVWPLLDDAAVAAVKQWIYEPYIIDGVPRSVIFTATVNFSLR